MLYNKFRKLICFYLPSGVIQYELYIAYTLSYSILLLILLFVDTLLNFHCTCHTWDKFTCALFVRAGEASSGNHLVNHRNTKSKKNLDMKWSTAAQSWHRSAAYGTTDQSSLSLVCVCVTHCCAKTCRHVQLSNKCSFSCTLMTPWQIWQDAQAVCLLLGRTQQGSSCCLYSEVLLPSSRAAGKCGDI